MNLTEKVQKVKELLKFDDLEADEVMDILEVNIADVLDSLMAANKIEDEPLTELLSELNMRAKSSIKAGM